MRRTARSIWILALLLVLPLTAAAETFTVTLDNGNTLLTRYQPKVSLPDEEKVMLLTESGNWISVPRARVVGVVSNTESRGFGRVINNTTIALGFAPNDAQDETVAPTDPTTAILNALNARNSQPQRDYSVQQFVDTESAGQGGFPSSFGAGSASSGSPGGFFQPGAAVVPAPAPPPPPGADQ